MNNKDKGLMFLKNIKDFLGWKLLAPLCFFGGFSIVLGPMKDDMARIGWARFIFFMDVGLYVTLALIVWKLLKAYNAASNSSATGNEDKNGGDKK